MANEYAVNRDDLISVADAIRSKGGTSDALAWPDGFVSAVSAIQTGGAASSANVSDVNFYDYDGTLLYSYTLEEAQAMTELPPEPHHDGLVFQRWNYTIDKVTAATSGLDVGATYTTDDGKTRIFIHLEEGRTSPMLGVCPDGTVDVDWGDGTEHDTLEGTSTSTVQWTPNHEYAAPGDYVISLTVDGSMGFLGNGSTDQYAYILRHSSTSDGRNYAYLNAVKAVWIGDGVEIIGVSAFNHCYNLKSIVLSDSVSIIVNNAFYYCYSLKSIVLPASVTSIGNNAFYQCHSLVSVTIPESMASIGDNAFYECYSLKNIVIPASVTSIGAEVFRYCRSLASVVIHDGVTYINSDAFSYCYSLVSVAIPESVTIIGNNAFHYCCSLARIVIPKGVTSITDDMFYNCYGVRFYDFTRCEAVPKLYHTNAFDGHASDFEIRVPAALYDQWIAATNWETYASYIVAA